MKIRKTTKLQTYKKTFICFHYYNIKTILDKYIMDELTGLISPELEIKLKTHLVTNSIKLCILTPCFGDICHV